MGLDELLRPGATGEDRFRAEAGAIGWKRLYGGQVMAQALAAASMTVAPERPCHSLHAYFLRPGAFDTAIDLEVWRDRDGRSFSGRRVVASQQGEPILTMLASFHQPEAGPAHDSNRLPAVPDPETLPTLADKLRAAGRDPAAMPMLDDIDIRPVAGGIPFDPTFFEPRAMFWFRFRRSTVSGGMMERVLLAYASDLFLLNAAIQPHRPALSASDTVASLDHALWFHAAPPVAEWMLYVQESPWAGAARGLSRGFVFGRDGRHLASVAQEGLIRLAS